MVHLLWIIPLFLGGFAGLWLLLCRLLALPGWGRLASHYTVPEEPVPMARFRLHRAALGPVSYRGVIGVGVSPAGLSLRTAPLFRAGHPPLLIPWAAIGGVQTRKTLWATYFSVPISTGAGSIELRFTEEALARALQT